jgi:hypothetical protein
MAAEGSMASSSFSKVETDNRKATGGVSAGTLLVATSTSESEERKQPFSDMYKLQPTRNKQAAWVAAVKKAVQECSAISLATVKVDAAAPDEDFSVQAPPTPARYTQTDWLAAISSTIKKVKKKPKAPKP